MRIVLSAVLLSLVAMAPAWAQSHVRVTDRVIGRVSPGIYGHFLEHIYDSVVGGLDAEMVRGRSFEEAVAGPMPEGIEVVRGPWRVEGDMLVVDEDGADYRVFCGDRAWTDYDYEVECQKISGAEGFLIIFRAERNNGHYWLNLGGWGNQYTALETEVGGRRTAHREHLPITIDTGRWYTVKISLRGPHIQCFLDGRSILDIEDRTHLKGRVGIGSWNTAYRARNLKVTAPDGRVLLQPKIEGPPPGTGLPGWWHRFPDDGVPMATYRQVSESPVNSAKCLAIALAPGRAVGIAQGKKAVQQGEAYRGSVWLRGEGVKRAVAGLRQAADKGTGRTEASLGKVGGQWSEHRFALRPDFTDANAELYVAFEGDGRAAVDQVSLYPVETYKGHGCRVDIAEKVAAIRPTFIRWPGGCFAERYVWTDGIGPQSKRRTHPNHVWGELDPAAFGTDEFIQLCRDVGAEPLIVFNIGQHDAAENLPAHVQECLDWIEYCNGPATSKWGKVRAANGHAQPYHVKHWELGNETWGLGAQELCRRTKVLSAAIRERWPNIVLWVCGSGGLNRQWNQEMLDGAAEAFDVLSVHHYQWGPSYEARMAGALQYGRFLRETGEQIKQSRNPDMRIGVTEWNLQTTSLETGLWAALFLMGCEQTPMVQYASPALFIRNVDAPAWDNAFINTDHYRSYPAPNYLAMKLLRDTLGDEAVEVEVETRGTQVQGFGEMAWLQASAVRDSDTGALSVRLVNLHPRQPSVAEVELPRAYAKATLQTMTGPGLEARNTLDEPDVIATRELPWPKAGQVMKLELPARSVSVLRAE